MVNIRISNLCVIVVTVAVSGWCLLPISSANTAAPRQPNETKSVYDKIPEAAEKEFAIDNSSNIFRNSLSRDKNVKLLSFTPTHSTASAEFKAPRGQLPQVLLEEHEMPVNAIAFNPVLGENVKIHNDVLYEIDESNQENNSNDENNNKLKPTFSLPNIKLANSSTLPPPSSSEATLTQSSFFERAEMHDESLTHTKSEQHLLHRHKRYLLFPAGSSFQLVFDLIIPIVDYTNFAIMGITCAVAWELPSKPPTEIIENFRTKLNDGLHGLNRRNDSTPPLSAYVNSHRKEFEAVHKQYLLPQYLAIESKPSPPQPLDIFHYNSKNIQHGHHPPQPFHGFNYDTFKTDNGKYSYKNTSKHLPIYRNSVASPMRNKQTNLYYSNTADNWWDRSKYRLKKNWQKQKWLKQPKDPQPFYQPAMFSRRTSRNRKILIKPPKHRIYPIFGKRRRRRSAGNRDDNFTKKLQAIHRREHFQTRQKLYRIIEKVYKTRGQNGTACVLRALCETTKRMHLSCHYNETPQSFVVELLRSIFALPKEIVANTKESPLHVDARYVDAILIGHDVTQSCSEKYFDCKYNILFG